MLQPLVLADYAVWRRLVAALGESGLRRLAMGDDGYGFDQNLEILRELAATGRVPRPLLWEPCEALALTMHSRGESLGAEDAADILVCAMVLSSAYWY